MDERVEARVKARVSELRGEERGVGEGGEGRVGPLGLMEPEALMLASTHPTDVM